MHIIFENQYPIYKIKAENSIYLTIPDIEPQMLFAEQSLFI